MRVPTVLDASESSGSSLKKYIYLPSWITAKILVDPEANLGVASKRLMPDIDGGLHIDPDSCANIGIEVAELDPEYASLRM